MPILDRLLVVAIVAIAFAELTAAKKDKHKVVKCHKDKDCHGADDGKYCIGWSVAYGKKFTGYCGAKASGVSACSRDLECKSGHCVAAYCMDMGKECEKGSRKPGCSFEITLDRSKGEKLGIEVSAPQMLISDIEKSGLVKKWNAAHPKHQVEKFYRIASVNGIKFWEKGMLPEAKKKKELKMVIVVGATPPKPKEDWELPRINLRGAGGTASPALLASVALFASALLIVAAFLAHRRRASLPNAHAALVTVDAEE